MNDYYFLKYLGYQPQQYVEENLKSRLWLIIYRRKRGNYLPLWDQAKIIDSEKHLKIRRLKESTHMLGYNDMLSRPSKEKNIIWESLIKKFNKNNCKMESLVSWWRHWIYKSPQFSLNCLATTHSAVDQAIGWKVLLSEIMRQLLVQSQQQTRITRNNSYNLTHVPSHG